MSEPTGIEDSELPKAVVTRVVKSKLPESINLAKDTREAFVKAATIFVSYLTATASDIAQTSNLKTVSADFVIKALEELEFEDMIPAIQQALAGYRLEVKEKRAASNRIKAGTDAGKGAAAGKQSGKGKKSSSAPSNSSDESRGAGGASNSTNEKASSNNAESPSANGDESEDGAENHDDDGEDEEDEEMDGIDHENENDQDEEDDELAPEDA